MTNQVKGFTAAVVAAVCYGTNPLGALPLYADGIHPASVLFYRYAIALAIFAVIMVARGERFSIKLGHAVRFSFLGAVFATSSISLYLSFRYMEAGVASTLLFVYPIMTAVLMTMFFHERVTWTTTAAILLAVAGVALLYRGDGAVRLSTAGFALVMASSLSYAIYIVSINQWENDMSPLKFTFWVIVFCLLSVVAYSWLSGDTLQLLQTPRQWLCVFQLGLLPTVLSLFFMTIGIQLIGSTPSAIMGALEPVTAVVIGVFVFHESFSVRLACGILLILGGVILIISKNKGKPKENAAAAAESDGGIFRNGRS